MSELSGSTEGAMDLEVRKKEDGSAAAAAAASSSVVRWEKFLPRMVVRVLLVESDDSTRQIIAALLRKCSYKVAAVGDGLKAWELLKGRPHNIDLILTEVELPSISGFALLTVIAEHDICKKIPVIMMSSNDSVSTVYKCMLRGAADFLVKPVRKNELKNLWQHVWRRQASPAGGQGSEDEQPKVEAMAENNATSNHSSGFADCVQRSREYLEKGSDAQSSCTKPDLEAERTCLENVNSHAEPSSRNFLTNEMNMLKRQEDVQKPVTDNTESRESAEAAGCNAVNGVEDMQPESCREQQTTSLIVEACNNNRALENSCTEAIDLIGAFNNHPIHGYRSPTSNNYMNNSDSVPLLDLSLRRSHPSSPVNQVTDERQKLHHSDSSAFSRYVNRTPREQPSTANVDNQQSVYSTTSDKEPSNHHIDSDSRRNLSAKKNVLSLGTCSQPEISLFSPQLKVFPSPIPATDLRLKNLSTAYGSAMPPIFRTQSGQEASLRENPIHHSNSETKIIQQIHDLSDENGNTSSNQTAAHKRWQNLETIEDQAKLYYSNDRSESSSFGNGVVIYCNNTIGGSNGYAHQNLVVRNASESGNEGSSQRSIQRDAALTKFRLKRKDRCYDKKVRYESRRKLAEQRPRVKGQFVRQVQTDHTLQ